MKQTSNKEQPEENSLERLVYDFSQHDKKIKTNSPERVKTTISFQERAKLGSKALEKQAPVTLSQARAQALNLILRSSERNTKQKEEAIKHHLEMYFPEFSRDQINESFIKLYSSYNETV